MVASVRMLLDNSSASDLREIDELWAEKLADDLDAFWLLFAACLVFFMQAGFTMLEAAAVRDVAIKSILLKNIFDGSIASLLWWSTGYAFAYGSDSFPDNGKNGFIGTSGFFYSGDGSGEDASPLTETPYARLHGKSMWAFNWAFAGVAATIVSGAVAERCKFIAYLVYSMSMTSVIYPIVVHAAWSADGRFSPHRTSRLVRGCGLIDFAGSGVVHMTGGIAGLIGAIMVGPREGRFQNAMKQSSSKYSSSFQTLGSLILWFGWYGFNIGSTGSLVGRAGLAAHVFMTTTIAAATGCLSTTGIGYILNADNKELVRNANNGILAGLVSITAGCATTNLPGAFGTALVAGGLYCVVSRMLLQLKIDDPVDAFAVHGACGLWGLIAAPLCATPAYYSQAYDNERADRCASIFYGGNPGGSLLVACIFSILLIGWVSVTTLFVFFILDKTIPDGVHIGLEALASWEEHEPMEASELVQMDKEEMADENARAKLTREDSESAYLDTRPGASSTATRDQDETKTFEMAGP